MTDRHPPDIPETLVAGKAAGLTIAALLIGNAALATGPLFVRLAAEGQGVGPVASAFWRLALGFPVLTLLALSTARGHMPVFSRRVAWVIVASGVLFAADLACWHLGIVRTKLANATLFGNSTSLIYPLWGYVVARAWPSRREGAALALAAAGALLLIGRSYQLSPEHVLGDVLSLAAGLFYTAYLIAIARARETLAPLPLLAASTLASALPMLGFALALGEPLIPHDWRPLIALAVVSQILGQGLMVFAIARVRPLIMGLALLTQPVVAATIGWMGFGERLGPADLAGAALIALALLIVRRS